MYQPSIVVVPLWLVFIYQLGLLTLHRYAMVRAFVPRDILQDKTQRMAIRRMFALGRRFDTKVLSIVLGVPLLVTSILLLFTPKVAIGLSSTLFLLCVILNGIIIGNFYYFKTYQNYYDIFMFGLVEDDTQAVLRNIYDDYPIIRLIIGVLISAALPAWLAYQAVVQQWFAWESIFGQVLLCIFTLVVWGFAARGAVRSKPLGRGNAQVSTLGILNKMVPDGLTAISWAWSDRKSQIHFSAVSLEEGLTLVKDFQKADKSVEGEETNTLEMPEQDTYMQAFLEHTKEKAMLYAQTPYNAYLAQHKPHVVFALMESFATNFLMYDNEKNNDLLGRLRPYWNKDIVFERFCSDYNGTAPSLANIFFHSYIQNISQSVAQNKSLQETPFQVYKAQGYKTIFITAGNMMWRNLANYLPLQGVDAIYDQNDIIEHFAQARQSLSYWGVADEYAFLMAEKLLKETEQPLFIAILSMTNHPPYHVPEHYQCRSLQESCLDGRYGKDDTERRLALSTFQYASDTLGKFIQAIEESAVGTRTIIAATGDHHVRGVYAQMPTELFASKAVPFFIHIPEAIKAYLTLHIDTQQLGSHKDIMPTLFHASLSEAHYWHAGGRNLLDNKKVFNFAFNETFFATDNYVVDTSASPFVAYQWGKGLLVEEEYILSDKEYRQTEAFRQFLIWQTNYLVQNALSSI